jgi:PAS domain S-box-containing protein
MKLTGKIAKPALEHIKNFFPWGFFYLIIFLVFSILIMVLGFYHHFAQKQAVQINTELYSPLRDEKTIIIITLLIIAGSAGILLIYQKQKSRFAEKLHDELKQSEERYRTVVDYASDSIIIAQDGLLKFVNPKVIKMLGYTESELLTLPFTDFIHPEDRAMVLERYQKRMQKEEVPSVYTFRVVSKNNIVHWVEIRAVLITWNQKPASLNFLTDITERRKSELALSESEKKYRELIGHSLIGICTIQDRMIKFCNPRFAEIMGYGNPEELIDMPIKNIASLDWKNVDSQLGLQEKAEKKVHFETKAKRKDNKIIDLEILSTSIYYGDKPAIQGSILDITERKQLESQLLQSQKLEAIGLLAGGIAHDFNNILTSMMGYSKMLVQKLKKDDPLQRYAANLLSSTRRAAEITKQLLTLSRKQIVQMQILNLNTLITEFNQVLKRLIGEHIEIIMYIDPFLKSIKADPAQLEQAIVNLAINARDSMPQGGKLIFQTESAILDDAYCQRFPDSKPGNYALLSITDTGHGMNEEILSQIFEPFFTTKEKGKGTGLGLSTAQGIIKKCGGYIEVQSTPGLGSTFKLYLPCVEESAELFKPEISTACDILPSGNDTILIAEDDTRIRELICEVLRQSGYTVLEARNGKEALALANKYPHPIHLLLSDVVMPQLSGPDLAKQLSVLRPDIKVLFISGYTDGELASYRNTSHSIPLLQKPFLPETLARRIRELLDAP